MQHPENIIELAASDKTFMLGEQLAEKLAGGGIVCLHGPLGAGKTTIVKGIGCRLGVAEVINSPTFMMLNEYHSGSMPLYHFDLYKITQDPDSPESKRSVSYLEEQLDELLREKCLVAIEWPEPLQAHLPADFILVRLDYGQADGRVAAISANSPELKSQITKIVKRVIST